MNRLEKEILACGSPSRQEGLESVKDFVFGPDFVGFSGHFPGQPILPAMAQLMAGALCAGEAVGEAITPSRFSRAKFLRPVLPGQPVSVRVIVSSTPSGWTAAVQLESWGETVSSFQFTLVRKEI